MTLITARSEVTEVGRVRVDPARAYMVLDELMDAYLKRQALYESIHQVNAPQTIHRPPKLEVGGLEHALWLFFAAMTDRRDISFEVYKRHRRLWEGYADTLYTRPLDLFMPQVELVKLLRERGFSMPPTNAEYRVACSETLFRELGGDPRNLYRGRSIDEIIRLKRRGLHLPGFGPKILSLYAIFLAENDMIKVPPDAFPVDVHVQRFALSTGIVTIKQEERNTILERILRPLLTKICHERGWSSVDVSHAVWLLGNQLCTSCSINVETQLLCPVYRHCGGAFSSADYTNKGLWKPDNRYPKGGRRPFGLKVTRGMLPFPTD